MGNRYRKELKYVITIEEYLQLKPWLENLLTADINGVNGTYTVRSLYFDSLYDNDYYDNADGILRKCKIRMRVYERDFNKIRLECKAKEGSDGIKYSLWISEAEARLIAAGNYSSLQERKDRICQAIYLRMGKGGYHPKTVVEYDRIAYSYPASDVRITFDRRVRGTLTGNGFFDQFPGLVPLMDYHHGIFEIKYNDFLPYQIKQLTKKLDRLPQANSKYKQARELL